MIDPQVAEASRFWSEVDVLLFEKSFFIKNDEARKRGPKSHE
jgi:hypothetical protein